MGEVYLERANQQGLLLLTSFGNWEAIGLYMATRFLNGGVV